MEASEFKKKLQEAVNGLSNCDGPSANTGVGFIISDIQDLIDEWESENHECSL